jgi:intracellular sulfur oxidation DsrE/DsrF family protein
MEMQCENPVRNDEPRQLILHVNFNGAEQLNFVLNNVENITEFYSDAGNEFEIRVITHGLGLHMLRDDTSPVKERLQSIAAANDNVKFFGCINTRERMAKAEGKMPDMIPEAIMVNAGLVEIAELQRAGWIYLKP